MGRGIANCFWSILSDDVLSRYDSHPSTSKLKPCAESMFAGTGLQHPELRDDRLRPHQERQVDHPHRRHQPPQPRDRSLQLLDDTGLEIGHPNCCGGIEARPGPPVFCSRASRRTSAFFMRRPTWKIQPTSPAKQPIRHRADEETLNRFPRLVGPARLEQSLCASGPADVHRAPSEPIVEPAAPLAPYMDPSVHGPAVCPPAPLTRGRLRAVRIRTCPTL